LAQSALPLLLSFSGLEFM